ncbi:MAG: hypothetical protein FWC56_02010, partial [Phycisphaerae bacterium]|nr:hypothetical protein [Phycisphaerae bacterium]
MTRPGQLILLGAGGHAKVVAELAQAAGWRITGFLAPRSERGAENLGAPLLGDGADLAADPAWLEQHDMFPAIGQNDIRWREFARLA